MNCVWRQRSYKVYVTDTASFIQTHRSSNGFLHRISFTPTPELANGLTLYTPPLPPAPLSRCWTPARALPSSSWDRSTSPWTPSRRGRKRARPFSSAASRFLLCPRRISHGRKGRESRTHTNRSFPVGRRPSRPRAPARRLPNGTPRAVCYPARRACPLRRRRSSRGARMRTRRRTRGRRLFCWVPSRLLHEGG